MYCGDMYRSHLCVLILLKQNNVSKNLVNSIHFNLTMLSIVYGGNDTLQPSLIRFMTSIKL